ncbi:hypothetical protein COCC4DRAFT_19168 [Bipolaris maydis ATCC 48331]|uniref:Uncharacterized protein n=2 Tax=Cochliobolus heterostrophus TaxID=5016 RepID=M2UQH0_COCH5|nr:uncharacterized protein COCC4DRAFT_19168 [Bipolaris maydis ATCC 48331]EMD90152.1 hypothetical protein COCHEDRAFT_1031502 [Bipolaris maydis C5]KAH7563033.1 hypothetical protein BM1_00080 [Bipolaris maydis]ENI09632.1 hypothetical protein COCC4DRAFT_19168 [Bipolaris maydis ATCC 48331]KAJ5025184.1 hypothetical protein J3E73DRAFT_257939 [Bipolaris maydis]KAJ5063772.1 hypothetical protein J3E74DRAFT_402250 [Bipolaris maydis]
MAWVPKGNPYTIFDGIPAASWHNVNHGGSLDINVAPHRQQQPTHGFRVIKNFEDKRSGIKYKAGMQGQLKEVDEKRQLGCVYIAGVTEQGSNTHRWVPLSCIEKGKQWETDMNNWRIEVQLPGHHNFDKRSWVNGSLPDTTVLGKTITRFLTAIRESPPATVPLKFVEFMEKLHIAVATNRIVAGIKTAGLYEILSSGRPFSVRDLVSASRYHIKDTQSSRDGGVYLRYHKTGSQVGYHWKSRSSYGYVGHSRDFAKRNAAHKSNYISIYGDLTRNSEVLHMIALCVLPDTIDSGLYYLVEQMFICMLGTYRPELLDRQSQHPSMVAFMEPARFLYDLSKEVFRITGWQGMLQRGADSCGIQFGANCRSPIFEYASKSEKFLFIREDMDIKEGNSTVPMAYYRRSNEDVITGPREKTPVVVTKIVENRKWKTFMIIWARITRNKTIGLDAPPPKSPYQLVFEVRKDGSAHPHAWARLPKIGPFTNWNQANSWAVRVEWEHPLGSGKWRGMYIQSGHAFELADPHVPGSLKSYVKGIAFLQWLTGSEPNHRHAWIPRICGEAHVLQCKKDMVNQIFTFQNQDPIIMLPGDVRTNDAMKALMMKSEYGLRVDVPYGDFGGAVVGQRKYCDTCCLIQGYFHGGDFPDRSCVQVKGNDRLCTTCAYLGRPCCSWTPGLPSLRTAAWSRLSPDQNQLVQKTLSILVRLPLARIPPELQSFTQQFRSIDDVNEEDDGSDHQDSEDEGEEDVDEEEEEVEDDYEFEHE